MPLSACVTLSAGQIASIGKQIGKHADRVATPKGPALLLPNMRSLKPTDLQIEVVGNERRPRFAASLANFGPGPMLVLPQGRSKCPRGEHPAVQGAAPGHERRPPVPPET